MKRLPISKRIPGRGWWATVFWWIFLPSFVRAWLTICYRMKVRGRENIPLDEMGAVYVSNHQSFIDPMLIGLMVDQRPFVPMVRQSLFDSLIGGFLMRGYQAIPIDREKGETQPMKEAIKQLKAGRRLILFPEGTRTRDGAIKSFKRGIMLLIKKAGVPVVPMAVEGAFDVWPAGSSKPRMSGRIACMAGKPIDPVELLKDGPDAGLERLRREIETMRLELRAELRRSTGDRYPAAGPADHAYWDLPEESAEEEI